MPWSWDNWDSTLSLWHRTALQHKQKVPKQKDHVLQQLLHEHAIAGPALKRDLNRRIWKRRRWIKRSRAKAALRLAAEHGRFPNTAPKNVVVNWSKLCGNADPSLVIHDFYQDIYCLDSDTMQKEQATKTERIETWRALRIDLLPFRFTMTHILAAISKLKNGKGSPDGCTAEMYKALPASALEKLCDFFTRLFACLDFPESWTVVGASLIPKVVGASSLSKFRAIACLPVARKLCGYLWMQMLPPLRFLSFQCGFIPGSHAASGVYTVKRAAELSREWNVPLFVAQLDLRKAFDRVFHSAVLAALRLQGASLQCVAVMSALLSQSKTTISLSQVRSEVISMQRGLPQGAPDSPLLFVLVTEMVLRPLLQKWRERQSGWSFSGLLLAAVCYADDIMVLSSSKADLQLMISELIDAFSLVGLDVSTDKCHWTSYPARSKEKLKFRADKVKWEPQLTFVGTILNFNGNDGTALENRLAQGTKVFHKWKPILQCRQAPLAARIRLTSATVFSAVLWLSETWHLTKRQQKQLNSWGARIMARVVGLRPRVEEDSAEFWRRLFRTGHKIMDAYGGSLEVRRRQRLHAFAGHLARQPDALPGVALRTRSLAWWRFFQQTGGQTHPKQFKPWRWEEQLVAYYGEACSVFVDESVGWMQAAQERGEWKNLQDGLAKASV